MKTIYYEILIWSIVLSVIGITTKTCFGSELNQVSLEVVLPTMTSNHRSDFKDEANEENGGIGGIVHYKRLDKYINVAAGHIELINSYGDEGSVTFFQPHAADLDFIFLNAVSFFAEFAIWFMKIEGYKDEYRTEEYYEGASGEARNVKRYEEKTVYTPPWPVFRFGVNPFHKITKDFRVDYRFVEFPNVSINFVTLTYRMRF